MQALTALWSLDGHNFYLLNQYYMVFLRKKQNSVEVKDFLTISLIHSFSKLFAKVLSSRLAPHMNTLVMPNRSVFIRVWAIHDNFIAVHSVTKLLHTCHLMCILHKDGIAKASDTVAWSFLLNMLRQMGFSRH
jgi:hypothetical protein